MIGRLWRNHRLLFLSFLAVLALAVLFGIRAALFAIHFHNAPPDAAIAGWMTPRFVGHSWHVPPEVIGEALGIDRTAPPKRMTLQDLADERGVPLSTLIDDLHSAIDRFRQAQQ